MSQPCPHPAKTAFPNREAAVREASKRVLRKRRVKALYVYRCRCGAWHLTRRRPR